MAVERVALVTGAGGFIGGHLVRRLLDDGLVVRAVDLKPLEEWHQRHEDAQNRQADLSILEECRRATEGADEVFNLACNMGGMGFIAAHKAECMLSVLINTHLLLAARDAKVDRYVFASSACVYPTNLQSSSDVRPLREEDVYPATPEDGYGWEKLFSERMCRHFADDFGLRIAIARYHNIYGPWCAWTGGREKAPAAICRKVALATLDGATRIDVWGDGCQTRSFTYIDDCLEGTLLLARSGVDIPINIGSSERVSINGLVDLVCEIAGVKLARSYCADAPQGVRGRNSDNTKVSQVLGWEPSTKLSDGMCHLYRWVFDQVRDQRKAG